MATNPASRPKGRSIRNLRMIWGFASRYPGHIAVAAIALAVAAAATVSIPWGFKLVIDKGFSSGAGNARAIAPWFETLLAVVAVMAVATAVRYFFVSWLGERTVADIRLAVHRNLLRLSPGFFEENRPAEITSRMTVDTTIIEQVVGTTVSVALRNIVMGVGCAITMFFLAPKLASGMLLGIPVVLGPMLFLGRRVRSISTRNQDRIADVGTVTSEVLGSMKIVQAFNQQGREATRFSDAVERVFATAKRRIALRALLTAMMIFLMIGSIVLVIWQGAVDVAAGRMSGGSIAAFVLCGGLLAGAFGNLSEVYGDLLRAAGASERLNELLEAEPDIRAPAKPQALPEPSRGELEFDAVTFRYPTRPEVSALNDFSLVVKPRERLAVVGPSGAGKTTIASLLLRFWDPERGAITLAGHDLRACALEELRSHIALVAQDTHLFNDTLGGNIRIARPEASPTDLAAAVERAALGPLVAGLPQGLDTPVGERGLQLSGGQRQRVAIARAFLRDAPVLILDEATSHLDAVNEAVVQEALVSLARTRTTIVIAHRLSTVRAADRIVVLDEGRVVEQGRHEDLLHRRGLYARLVSRQVAAAVAS